MVLEMLFLTFSNMNIQFVEREIVWRDYTIAESLRTIRMVDLIDKKDFAEVAGTKILSFL